MLPSASKELSQGDKDAFEGSAHRTSVERPEIEHRCRNPQPDLLGSAQTEFFFASFASLHTLEEPFAPRTCRSKNIYITCFQDDEMRSCQITRVEEMITNDYDYHSSRRDGHQRGKLNFGTCWTPQTPAKRVCQLTIAFHSPPPTMVPRHLLSYMPSMAGIRLSNPTKVMPGELTMPPMASRPHKAPPR